MWNIFVIRGQIFKYARFLHLSSKYFQQSTNKIIYGVICLIGCRKKNLVAVALVAFS